MTEKTDQTNNSFCLPTNSSEVRNYLYDYILNHNLNISIDTIGTIGTAFVAGAGYYGYKTVKAYYNVPMLDEIVCGACTIAGVHENLCPCHH